MKTQFVFACVLIMALPVPAQTNFGVSIVVEVPSLTFEFPNTMTLQQMDKVLQSHFFTNLTYTFLATNNQTHDHVKFTGNSIPNTNELEELFAYQRQRDASKISPRRVPQKLNSSVSDSTTTDILSDTEERKAAALERQAEALERQADALENQRFAQERVAIAAEDQAFHQRMLQNDINLHLILGDIESKPLPPITHFEPFPTVIALPPIRQPDQTKLIMLPGQVAPIIIPPPRPGEPQLITVPGLNGPVIVPP